MEDKTEASKELLTCDDCGKQSADVRATTCPYADEIHGETVPCVVCDDCYNSRLREI